MKKLTIRKISILGMVLLAASAVTAAVLPSTRKDATSVAGNSLTDSNDGDLVSCATTAGTVTEACTETNSDGAGAASRSTAGNGSQSNQTSD